MESLDEKLAQGQVRLAQKGLLEETIKEFEAQGVKIVPGGQIDFPKSGDPALATFQPVLKGPKKKPLLYKLYPESFVGKFLFFGGLQFLGCMGSLYGGMEGFYSIPAFSQEWWTNIEYGAYCGAFFGTLIGVGVNFVDTYDFKKT